MGSATTTAGWAILVMVAVTAIAAWPVQVGEHRRQHPGHHPRRGARRGRPARRRTPPPAQCDDPTPGACKDNRPPAVRASDTATETMLYRNWLRGVLGSADSETAQKYGRALYDATVAHLGRGAEDARQPGDPRGDRSRPRSEQWEKVAEQIKTEDPEAYEYLQGINGMDRIGAGFIAVLAARHVRDVRPDRVAAGAARLPDLPMGGHRRTDPRHGRPAAAGQRRASGGSATRWSPRSSTSPSSAPAPRSTCSPST